MLVVSRVTTDAALRSLFVGTLRDRRLQPTAVGTGQSELRCSVELAIGPGQRAMAVGADCVNWPRCTSSAL